MGVLVLMYHRTPRKAGHMLDVAMPLFRAQIQAVQAEGVRFIRFAEALDRCWYGDETVVSVTFDDGHASNLEAMAFLHDLGIPPTSFFISDFVRRGQDGFIGVMEFEAASELSDVGAHGATHSGLATLSPVMLDEELSASKMYLEDLCGKRVTTMSAPGGSINRRVVRAALNHGFEVIGDSKPFLNLAPRLPLHRVCMLCDYSPEHVISLIRAGQMYWLSKRLRWATGSIAVGALGHERLIMLKRKFKISSARRQRDGL